ncbi:MAG: hypothetical protein AB7I38_16970 [Dehalococcoidia bacterium]
MTLIGDIVEPRTIASSTSTEPTAPAGVSWTLIIAADDLICRRVVVLAPSPEGALLKGREQLDDGETLTFCLPDASGQYLGLPQTSGVYARR